MTTSAPLSFLASIDWPSVIAIILGSGVVAALLSGFVAFYLAKRAKENERYENLYGPLKFQLLSMKLIVENKEEVLTEIKKWASAEMRIDLMTKHLSPLTIKWLQYRDNVRRLLEGKPGLIKIDDFDLVKDFLDGCIKREIIEEGKNVLAVNENMMNKLLDAVENFQKKLL